jgi:hypothetical protein
MIAAPVSVLTKLCCWALGKRLEQEHNAPAYIDDARSDRCRRGDTRPFVNQGQAIKLSDKAFPTKRISGQLREHRNGLSLKDSTAMGSQVVQINEVLTAPWSAQMN